MHDNRIGSTVHHGLEGRRKSYAVLEKCLELSLQLGGWCVLQLNDFELSIW